MSWIEACRYTRVADVAQHHGQPVQKSRGASGGSCACPACGAHKRHTKSGDKRGAVGIRRDGRGWRCMQCDASGDALDFVAYALTGRRLRDADTDQRAKVREWFEGEYGTASAPREPRPAPAPAAPPNYPPAAEVRRLLSRCVGVTGDAPSSDLLRSRGLVPRVFEERDLGSALPEHERSELVPAGYGLVFRLYDRHGELCSVLARRTGPGDGPKSRAPRGYARTGLVMADALGLHLLKTGSRPSWWDARVPLRVVLAEGEIDWATAACEASDADEHAPAVLGVFNGSWTPELAARLPDGCHVIIATDSNRAGDAYAAQIASTLAERDVTLLRWRAAA